MLTIRVFKASDRDAVIELWRASDLLVNPLKDPATDIDFATRNPNATVMVAEDAGRICATAMVGHDGHRGWLYYVATDPSLRQTGIGRQIVHACELWLGERGVPKVQLIIRSSNTRVIGFYQRLGYVVEPREIMSKRLDGRAVAVGGQKDTDPVTITYLEMAARGTLPRIVPAGKHRLALLRAHPPTLNFYRYLYDAIGRDWFWTDRKMLSDDALTSIIRDEKVELFVLYADGSPAGAFELDRRTEGVIDLAYFGIMPEFIGQRFGPYLLAEALETAWSYGPDKVTVNTCTLDHPKALPMYQRFGFEVVGRRTVPSPWARGEAESDD